MAKRHADALCIQAGASNPSGVANSIMEAVREARNEGAWAQDDSAIKLMVHQLSSITNISNGDDYWWADAVRHCCRLAIESGHMTDSLRYEWAGFLPEEAISD